MDETRTAVTFWPDANQGVELARNPRGGVEYYCQGGEAHLVAILAEVLLDIDHERRKTDRPALPLIWRSTASQSSSIPRLC
jgi:hypothetical protein